MRHVTAIPTTTAAIPTTTAAIPTTTAAVRKVRQHDRRRGRIRAGPTGFRCSMPSMQACRYVLARLYVATLVLPENHIRT